MKQWLGGIIILLFLGCAGSPEGDVTDYGLSDTDFVTVRREMVHYTATEQRLLAFGLVDVQALDPSIQVHLVYATPDNFIGEVLYSDFHHSFFLPALSQKIVAAQQALRSERPDLSLLILDAVRPISVQYRMFHLVQGTPNNIYVANPLHGPGLHNYGAAVDVTLVDSSGNLLPMGSAFDHFGPESHITSESRLLSSGAITPQELDNRKLLRSIMKQQGLQPLNSEWWHFNLMSRTQARQRLRVVE